MLRREYDLPVIREINRKLFDLCKPPNVEWLEKTGAGFFINKSELTGKPIAEIWSPAEKLDQAMSLAKQHSHGITLETFSDDCSTCFISSKTEFPSAKRKGDSEAHAVCEALIVVLTGKECTTE